MPRCGCRHDVDVLSALPWQLCVNTVLPLAPLALGRGVLALAGLPARHDLYAAVLGVYVLWAAGLLARQVYHLSQVLN